eukprot:TRINITY_DN22663_c0_g1_i1.p2 TRINITY_DN22663_c0_g1~~TRINITY_DN22663_c0_g1_i1.p2  ORF type:complete len:180 (+),score=38.03 TRINITY_DN22663_c0_g1_i1:77-541(+)
MPFLRLTVIPTSDTGGYPPHTGYVYAIDGPDTLVEAINAHLSRSVRDDMYPHPELAARMRQEHCFRRATPTAVGGGPGDAGEPVQATSEYGLEVTHKGSRPKLFPSQLLDLIEYLGCDLAQAVPASMPNQPGTKGGELYLFRQRIPSAWAPPPS